MGAGKSTVGSALAQRLGWTFVDLDDVIIARHHRSIAAIFDEQGESAFRAAEGAALREVLTTRTANVVLALGGGAFTIPANRDLLSRTGVLTVFLDAPVEELAARCQAAGAERPLFRDPNHFRQLFRERHPVYMEASVRLDTSRRSVDEVVAELMRIVAAPATSTPPEVRS